MALVSFRSIGYQKIKSWFLLLLFMPLSLPSFAQWDWDSPKQEEVDLYNKERLFGLIMTDISELERPEWHDDFTNLVADLPQKFQDQGLVCAECDEWEELLDELTKRFSIYSDFNRDHVITVLMDPTVNALSTEGGLIFVNIGLLADIGSIDELAWILAHEMGHVHFHHPYHGYVKQREAQNKANIGLAAGIVLGGIVGGIVAYGTHASAWSSFMEYSRYDESVADLYACDVLRHADGSALEGGQILRLFERMAEKRNILTGKGRGESPYGSTHPAAQDRFEVLTKKFQSSDGEGLIETERFIALRTKARLEKLRLLKEEEAYRDLVETAWRYLINDPENNEYKEYMLDGLNGLQKSFSVSFLTGGVLYDGYHIDPEIASSVEAVDLDSKGVREYYCNVLLMNDVEDDSPYALNSTFYELKWRLEYDLGKLNDVESFLFEALNSQSIDESKLKEYVDKGGKNADYAKYLIDPGTVEFTRTIVLPLHMVLEPCRSSTRDYQQVYSESDWKVFRKQVLKDYSDAEFLNLYDDQEFDMNERNEMLMLSTLFQNEQDQHTEWGNIFYLHPGIANYLVKNKVKRLIIADIIERPFPARVQITEISNGRNARVKKSTFYGKHGLKEDCGSDSYVPTQFKWFYKKHQKLTSNGVGQPINNLTHSTVSLIS